MEEKYYMIFNTSEVSVINFSEVLEDSSETIRKSIDQSKTFVKWYGQTVPTSIQNLISKEGPYNHSEILEILKTSFWVNIPT